MVQQVTTADSRGVPVVFELAGHFIFGQANDDLPTLRSRECAPKGGMQVAKAAR